MPPPHQALLLRQVDRGGRRGGTCLDEVLCLDCCNCRKDIARPAVPCAPRGRDLFQYPPVPVDARIHGGGGDDARPQQRARILALEAPGLAGAQPRGLGAATAARPREQRLGAAANVLHVELDCAWDGNRPLDPLSQRGPDRPQARIDRDCRRRGRRRWRRWRRWAGRGRRWWAGPWRRRRAGHRRRRRAGHRRRRRGPRGQHSFPSHCKVRGGTVRVSKQAGRRGRRGLVRASRAAPCPMAPS
jgi:hypothetical protein